MTARIASPNTMLLRTLSAANTTNAVSTANTAPLTPIWLAGPVAVTWAVCGNGSRLGAVLRSTVLASRPQPASTEHAEHDPDCTGRQVLCGHRDRNHNQPRLHSQPSHVQ